MSQTATLLLAALVVVGVASALVFLAYNHELTHARAEATQRACIASTAAGPIEYAETGAGIPLLSIHGAGGGFDQGLANVADLVGNDFRVIAPSRFGYLGTPVPSDTSSASQADAHAALLTGLKVDKAIVVGISAGARSAVQLALCHPERVAALILIVPGTYAPASPVAIEGSRTSVLVLWLVNIGADFAWWATEKIAPSILIRFIGVRPQLLASAPQAEQDRVMQIVRSIQPLSQRFRGINIDSNPDLSRPSLEHITVPTLVISTRDDLFNTLPAAEFAANTIPNAKLVVYDTGGHLLVGRQQVVRALVRDFLAKELHSSAPGG
ncbi:MAG: alpha/beta hydrolase [Hyphomonadaceae bacterium]|jgi:pimeloyl-ACP methyl ester carboxylesterase|nr:alpha/beta hydrolase [Hyphomonadaceae bacterium]